MPALLAMAVLLAGCGTGAPSGVRPSGPTVTVRSAGGDVTVPVTDSGIWALDYQTALNLLALGVVPEHAGKYAYTTDPFVSAAYAILEDAGVELVEPGRAERVAAAAPELIVGMPRTGSDEIVPQLRELAPVVLLPDLPVLADDLATLGAVTGHRDEAAAVAERVDAAVGDLARRVKGSEHAGSAVSVLSAYGEDSYCIYGNARGFGPLLAELGLTRPPAQAVAGNEWGYATVSPEKLDEQGADVVVAFVGSVALGAPSPLTDERLDTSGSVTGEVDYSAWFGVGPLNAFWVLGDLRAILFDEGRIAGASDGPALWDRVTGGTA
ncbi:ABC transporter substrate-binding protein [Streptomyces sp. NPDC048057]|uniref:ABC transporter substrate-binding protein n=1 Tax=Streptomyces sp. NPDC048057 TaxID=3155628 RepID=UPI003402DE8C